MRLENHPIRHRSPPCSSDPTIDSSYPCRHRRVRTRSHTTHSRILLAWKRVEEPLGQSDRVRPCIPWKRLAHAIIRSSEACHPNCSVASCMNCNCRVAYHRARAVVRRSSVPGAAEPRPKRRLDLRRNPGCPGRLPAVLAACLGATHPRLSRNSGDSSNVSAAVTGRLRPDRQARPWNDSENRWPPWSPLPGNVPS
ncbi:hypothetical protein BO70DRAFT_100732 [Aspergillus heteromorphus CBS 117.55]|uniref:Uncharacterized protein n=1 Tax=Aspergillus heteromorphus CBS 117.55 TaxID=1448321 RepID=A0A317VL71_9EURO|nr:uncharacterized protein BO70DRAFT_100732 [Aspergillus heteromorphus CBS 117.55]PWY75076.1 hypothetical protein BO70DRAFT_100732 [Aspergillus heteromorphus CBS 117.55]